MHIVTARQMQELDRKTIYDVGIPGAVLMENAGRGTFELIKRFYSDELEKPVAVLCGRGNNGGDGFVIARYLLNAGCNVRAVLLANVDEVRGDARINLDAFQNMGGLVREVADEVRWKELAAAMSHAGLVVDALLGTGLSSDVRDLYRRVIQDINSLASLVVVSVDIPSGIDATTGRVLGVAVKADLTCTYGLAKRGQHFYPGAEHVGRLEVIDIGIPRRLVDMAGITEHVQEASDFAGMLPLRAADSHKGTYGHAGIIAGSPGKTGAAALAARAAMRIGAGLVTLGVPGSLNAVLEQKVTEVMTESLPDEDGFLGHAEQDCVRNLLPGKKVIALGPELAIRNHTCD
ncbi:MAG: NAD(P)H-hydrate epimerase, partial [Deltaproteobacteria bacterium]|nr:NAD(P)H-hydrate epimerase [Deltaproteobacteria bacterium]